MESLKDFIDSRRGRWSEFVRLLEKASSRGIRAMAPEEVSRFCLLFRRLCADLACAQTYFPDTRAAQMLNRMVVRAHGFFYQYRPRKRASLSEFFGREFPLAFAAIRPLFSRATGLFLFGLALGAAITLKNPEFPRLFLPENAWANFTEGSLQAPAPGSLPGGIFFSGLLTNNISVTFLAFAGGLLLGLGTAAILIFNGVLIGALAILSLEAGAWTLFLHCLCAHGFLEISVFCMAGAAGLSMGDALVNPGPYLRRDSLRARSRDAIRVVIGGIPFLAVAAVVEAYVSPSPAIPLALKATLGIALAAMLFIYPVVSLKCAVKKVHSAS